MSKPRLLLDVDGPCAGMIPAYLKWFHERFGIFVDVNDIAYHNNMGSSPRLAAVDSLLREIYPTPGPDGGFGGAYLEFMRNPRVYSEHVLPTPGAPEAIEELKEHVDIAFVTALMKRANVHVPDKLDWIGRTYPGLPIFTVPSEYKHWVKGHFAVDDRWDTCARWRQHGSLVFTYKMPWSELPEGERGYDWPGIVNGITTFLKGIDDDC